MYYPNVFSFDVEKFFSGELDISKSLPLIGLKESNKYPLSRKQ